MGGYQAGRHVPNFAGFAPADDAALRRRSSCSKSRRASTTRPTSRRRSSPASCRRRSGSCASRRASSAFPPRVLAEAAPPPAPGYPSGVVPAARAAASGDAGGRPRDDRRRARSACRRGRPSPSSRGSACSRACREPVSSSLRIRPPARPSGAGSVHTLFLADSAAAPSRAGGRRAEETAPPPLRSVKLMELAAVLPGAESARAPRRRSEVARRHERLAGRPRRAISSSRSGAPRSTASRYVPEALARGARSPSSPTAPAPEGGVAVPWIAVAEPRRALGRVAARLHGDPAEKLVLAGVTGTNGKTSTTTLLEAILARRYGAAGFLGTIGYRTPRRSVEADRTTPEATLIQEPARGDARRRRAGRGARGLVARARARPRRGMPLRRRRLHEPDARPPRLPRRHGGVLRGEEAPLRPAQARRVRRRQRRRSLRPAAARGDRAAAWRASRPSGGERRRSAPRTSAATSGRRRVRARRTRAAASASPRRCSAASSSATCSAAAAAGLVPRRPGGRRRRRRSRGVARRARAGWSASRPGSPIRSSWTTPTRRTPSSGCSRPCGS